MFVSELAHGCSCCLPFFFFFFFSRAIRFCDALRRYKPSAVDVLRHYYRQAPIQSISYWYKTRLAIASVKHPIRKRFAPRRKTSSDTYIHLFRLFLRNFAHSPSFFVLVVVQELLQAWRRRRQQTATTAVMRGQIWMSE